VSDAPKPSGGWTVETAMQHVLALIGANDHRYEQRFIDAERAVSYALAAAKEAVIKAEQAAEKRFESVNEFRNTLSDQQRNLLPRSEADRAFAAMAEKIRALEKQHDTLVAERLGVRGGWGYAVGVIGLVITLFSLFMVLFRFKG
jgi:predicted transcriptional regulator